MLSTVRSGQLAIKSQEGSSVGQTADASCVLPVSEGEETYCGLTNLISYLLYKQS